MVLFLSLGSLTAISVPKMVEKNCHAETRSESINKNIKLKTIKLIKKAVKLMLMPAIFSKKLNNIIDKKNSVVPVDLKIKGGVNMMKSL